MPKTFEEFGPNVVRKEDAKKDDRPRKDTEIRPFLSELGRKQYRETTGREMSPKDFGVWIVQTENAWTRSVVSYDAATLQQEFNEDTSPENRFVQFSPVPQHELRHRLRNAYRARGEVSANLVPDLIVVQGGDGYVDTEPTGDLALKYMKWETDVIRDIRAAADSALHHQDGIETGDPIKDGWTHQYLSSDILGERAISLMYEKQSVTPERALEYAVTHAFQSDADWEAAVKSFDTYVRTGDVVTLRKTVTPGRIHKALGWSSKVSEKRALEDYHWRKRNYQQDGGFKNDEEYLKYRQSLAEAVCALTSETPEEETAEKFFATFKRLVDEKKETYLQDVEQDAAEMRLLQPLIVSVSKSRRYQEKALEAGADMVFRELSQEDMEKLVALGNRIRTSPASVATERLRRNKSDFYQDVVDQLEDRSEQTADTEKELFLLASLFEKTGTKKVLDVGCGYGRLALPLAKQGYDVTGLDVSRTLLEKAKADKGTRRNLHYKSGDIIDYRGTVDKENFDAVYYGWHSFLEAYGPGNALTSLHSAREALKPGGILAFDQPSRENPGLEDGWYGDEAHGYMAYLMEDDELKFLLAAAGFEDIRILRWRAKESSLYPDGMKKVTVVARKPTF